MIEKADGFQGMRPGRPKDGEESPVLENQRVCFNEWSIQNSQAMDRAAQHAASM